MSKPSPASHCGCRLTGWCWLAVVALCFAAAGCQSWGLRGEGYGNNELSTFCSKMRPADATLQPSAFTNKGQQIEQSLGVR